LSRNIGVDGAVWDDGAMAPDIATRYRFAQASFAALARTLADTDWDRPVPCTPEWTVRDVLSHVAGIPDDALAGRMEGAPGEAWTAAQVERNRSLSVDELLTRWAEQAPAFADVLQQIGETRPPFDCHTHEHDVRHAVGRPGNRDSIIVESMALDLARVDSSPVPLQVTLIGGRSVRSGPSGVAPAVTVSNLSSFELFRSRPGRRSREQIRAWNWTGSDVDIETVIDHWAFFGPTATPILE
jgi:uncharacterized protein (TIGR03083 family)